MFSNKIDMYISFYNRYFETTFSLTFRSIDKKTSYGYVVHATGEILLSTVFFSPLNTVWVWRSRRRSGRFSLGRRWEIRRVSVWRPGRGGPTIVVPSPASVCPTSRPSPLRAGRTDDESRNERQKYTAGDGQTTNRNETEAERDEREPHVLDGDETTTVGRLSTIRTR